MADDDVRVWGDVVFRGWLGCLRVRRLVWPVWDRWFYSGVFSVGSVPEVAYGAAWCVALEVGACVGVIGFLSSGGAVGALGCLDEANTSGAFQRKWEPETILDGDVV